ncbi:aminotransferase class V-fold PLP-dependent enzyme [Candidatus Peregrinibacteria bacterium]|nr:aminotransferase class V-fold PLP-dependent enzyme [Candidatus Peregrinibacteria bacterium]
MTFDWQKIKAEFPIFNSQPELVFLDNASTTQKPLTVLDAERNFYLEANANVHRGVYEIAEKADQIYESVRSKVAAWIGAEAEEIVFVKNATEGANLLAAGMSEILKKGNSVVVTELEHHANYIPWQQAAKKAGAEFRVIGIDKESGDNGVGGDGSGNLDLNNLEEKIDAKCKVVAITMMSNVTGAQPDLTRIIARAKAVGAIVVLDAAQAAVHLKLEVKKLEADAIFFTGHKLYGPMGTGILYMKKNLAEKISPLLFGGGMVKELPDQWLNIPHKFEAGTPNVAGLAGLGAAIDFLSGIDRVAALEHEKNLVKLARKGLTEIVGVKLLGDEASSIISFTMEGIHPHDIASILAGEKVCIRAGHHCAKPLMNSLGLTACARVSFALYNSEQDVEKLIAAVKKARSIFK